MNYDVGDYVIFGILFSKKIYNLKKTFSRMFASTKRGIEGRFADRLKKLSS